MPKDREAIHAWFGLTYANYLVVPRAVLQSMPDEWQTRFVACLEEMGESFGHLNWPTYDVRALERECERLDSEPCPTCDGSGIKVDGAETPGEVCEDCDGEGEIPCDRLETPEEVGIVSDPIPRYNRGRTRIEPRRAS